MYHNIRIIVMSLCAATITACSNVEYVKRSDIDAQMYSEAGYVNGERSKYGALRLNADEDSRIFMLRKDKKYRMYSAETLLSDNRGNPDSLFNQTFMSVGSTRDTDMMGVRFRITFDRY